MNILCVSANITVDKHDEKKFIILRIFNHSWPPHNLMHSRYQLVRHNRQHGGVKRLK
jgi:hypothetical protein